MAPTPDKPAPFLTFYSFKGGVGRSMAMINVACALAGRGFRVLAIDMDLEAPGVSFMVAPEHPGVVDLLLEAAQKGDEADFFAKTPAEVVAAYSFAYPLPDAMRRFPGGSLHIMPSGRRVPGYQQRLADLGLGKLYLEGNGLPLIQAFKYIIQESAAFDMVLVDSRTGYSDEAGICTRDLADALVVLSGLNRQNVEGTAEFLGLLRKESVVHPVRVVLSPVPSGEEEFVDQRVEEATRQYSAAVGKNIELSLQIPYHPRLALTEEPQLFYRKNAVFRAYTEIETAVLGMLEITPETLRRSVEEAVRLKDVPAIMQRLRVLSHLDDSRSTLEGLVVTSLKPLWILPEAEELRGCLLEVLPEDSWVLNDVGVTLYQARVVQAGDFYRRALEGTPANAVVLGNYAIFLQYVLKDYERAETLYRRALEAASHQALNIGNYASFLTHNRQDYPMAETLYQRAIELDPSHANNLANYAQLLYLQNRNPEAEQLATRALSAKPPEDTLCELHFYRYAHSPEHRAESLTTLKKLLLSGASAPHWHLEKNVEVAIAAEHPAPEFLKSLADVITGKAAISSLESFAEWK